MESEETIEYVTTVDLNKSVFEWADIGATGVQVCMRPGDVVGTYHFRAKPGVRHVAHWNQCEDPQCQGCL